jgi:hypothetical protein
VVIRCPADCRYLDAGQRHPAAVVRKQQEHDLGVLVGSLGQRFTEGQLRLFFLLGSVVARYRPDGLATLTDADVAEAAAAMAGTLEAAGSGLIARLTGASSISEGLRRQLDATLAELGKDAGAGFAQDAAQVLRGLERGAAHVAPGVVGSGPRDYIDVLTRVLPPPPEGPRDAAPSLLILP